MATTWAKALEEYEQREAVRMKDFRAAKARHERRLGMFAAVANWHFNFDDPRLIRAATFLQNGQRYESWLPVGAYAVVGECELTEGRGSPEMAKAVKVRNRGNGAFWYIGLDVARLHNIVA